MIRSILIIFTFITLSVSQPSLLGEQECKENESFETCGTACEPSCDNPNPSICTMQCFIGCQCDTGFVRDANKKCVKIEECNASTVNPTTPATNCSSNEVFSDCYNSCSEKKCANDTEGIACPAVCRQGCTCQDGFARNTDGECVKESDCVSNTSTSISTNPCSLVDCHPESVCKMVNGEAKCIQVKPVLTCATILCKSGYECKMIGNRGRCIKSVNRKSIISCANVRCGTQAGCAMVIPAGCTSEDCTPQPMCIEKNECDSSNCESAEECVLQQVKCVRAPCNPIATCKKSADSVTCGENEDDTECYNACVDRKCDSDGLQICTKDCRDTGCYCKTGFYRNASGKCVPKSQCSNSTLAEDSGNSCNNSTCVGIIDENPCLENSTKCIEKDTGSNDLALAGCESVTCPEGEECQETTDHCDSNTSNDTCIPYVSCIPTDPESSSNATQGCDVVTCEKDETCQESQVQCSSSPCPVQVSCVKVITKSENRTEGSITSCARNETYSECANLCTENRCSESNVRCTMNCSEGCTCNTGYARNSTGSCVLQDDCSIYEVTVQPSEGNLTCSSNETLSSCYNSCNEDRCVDPPNTQFCTNYCRLGCSCNESLYRSNDGNCYEYNDCPEEEQCEKNEEYRCDDCEPTCDDPFPKCDRNNCTMACKCATGFVYLKGKCVTLSKCPSHTQDNVTCLATEEYTDCVPKCHTTCAGKQKCDENISTNDCESGCVCRQNYKRDSNGECVHNRLCYKTTECPENETWDKCGDLEDTCDTLNGATTSQPKHEVCYSGCICFDGFARNSNGTCVEASKC